jgi:hypothetical protein
MSGYTPYVFTDQQLVDIRRFCGYPAAANGQVLFPAPWVNVQYLALNYRLVSISQDEGATVLAQYLTPLLALEQQLLTAATDLNVAVAGVFTRNVKEIRERKDMMAYWARRLCAFLGVLPGPDFVTGCSGTIRQVV